ncbi:MAG: TlpA disulfide reductase family protein [Phycisphaerales bacterium]
MRRLLFLVAIAGSILALASPARGDRDPFPDDWFFSGKDRPKALRDLEGTEPQELVTQAWIGDETKIKDARGKVVVIDFWATWCGPCMAAIPENVELVSKYKDKGLVFIGVHDANSGWDRAAGVVQSKGINYPIAHDKGDSAKNIGLSFWPTYVVIDRKGKIRGAGLVPNKVKDAVELLLAEPAPAGLGGATATSGIPADWYFGGADRPAWLRELEGKPLAPLPSSEWRGKAITDADRKGHVTVVHFVSPSSALSMRQLGELSALNDEFAPQGVVFVGVCDARADWTEASAAFDAQQVKLSIVKDAAPPAAAGTKRPSPAGATATALGLRATPVTLVVDRAGIVRAAGIRPDKVKAMVGKLLAEPIGNESNPTSAAAPAR